MTLLLTASDLEAVVDRAATRAAVARAFAGIAEGTVCQPAPTSMQAGDDEARFLLMAAVAEAPELAAVKILADVPGNHERGLATQRSVIVAVERHTGEPRAVLHGAVPTRVRTAAASAVATDALARGDSRVLGLIGAGALAREHVEALRGVRPFERLVVWSRTRATAEAFADRVAWEGDVDVVGSPEEVCAVADVLCTLTPSTTPVVTGAMLRPGQHLNVVGARPRADEREVDATAMARASVWVDDRATAETKSGDLLLAVSEGALRLDDVVGTLGETLAGRARGRSGDDEITLFDSVGIGAQDLVVADLLIRAAAERGLGVEIDLAG